MGQSIPSTDDKQWITFENGGQRLFGVLHRPLNASSEKPKPGVIICHGFGGNKCGKHRLYVRIATLLAASGIAVLRFDFRGSGDSDGDFHDMDLTSEVSDTLAAVQYLRQQDFVDSDRLGLLGRSLGGAIAVLAAPNVQNLRCLALWAPVFSASQWREQWEQAQAEGTSQLLDEEFVAFDGQLTNLAFVKQFFGMDLNQVLPEISMVPLLHLHGGQDVMVNTQHATDYEEARKAAGAESHFVMLENCDHDFSEVTEQQRLLEETRTWMTHILSS